MLWAEVPPSREARAPAPAPRPRPAPPGRKIMVRLAERCAHDRRPRRRCPRVRASSCASSARSARSTCSRCSPMRRQPSSRASPMRCRPTPPCSTPIRSGAPRARECRTTRCSRSNGRCPIRSRASTHRAHGTLQPSDRVDGGRGRRHRHPAASRSRGTRAARLRLHHRPGRARDGNAPRSRSARRGRLDRDGECFPARSASRAPGTARSSRA